MSVLSLSSDLPHVTDLPPDNSCRCQQSIRFRGFRPPTTLATYRRYPNVLRIYDKEGQERRGYF